MSLTLKMRKQPIAIDIQDHVIRFVEVKELDIKSVSAFGERRLPKGLVEKGKIIDHKGFERFLKKTARKWKIKSREVYFHVPDPLIYLRKVEIPEDISEEEIKGYLYMEVGSSILLPFEDPAFDYALLPNEEGENKEILLFVSPRPVVTEYADLFKEASLRPIAADITPLSCYRFLNAAQLVNSDEHIMCIQYNREMANVSLFYDDKPFFTRELMGESQAEDGEQEISTYFQLSDSFQELDRIMNFYTYSLNQGNASVSKIFIMGDNPELLDITEDLESFLDIPVISIGSKEFRTLSGKKIPTRFLLTLGLALKGQDDANKH